MSLEKEKKKAFNAMLLRNKAMIWHICSDYSLGKVWNVEDCMQEVIDSYEGQDENYQQLLQFINELPEENGMIIRAHLDGFSYQEIAEMTNLTESAVAMRIVLAKIALDY